METKSGIEKEVESTLDVARKIRQADTSAGYPERTMYRISSIKDEPVFSASHILKVAAILVLVYLNVYTISHIVKSSDNEQYHVSSANIDDLVQDYQVSDVSSVWLNNNTPFTK